MRRTAVLLASSFLALSVASARADEPDDAAARGKAVAERVCAACHALAPGQASPRPPAPPFASFAGRFTELTLQRRLTEITETGHTQMPGLAMHSDEIADLVAYLNSQPTP